MVAIEVVARDHHGESVSWLSADDFQLFEQVASKRERVPQKISAFRAVSIAEAAAVDKGKLQFPAGVYTNFVTAESSGSADGLADRWLEHRA